MAVYQQVYTKAKILTNENYSLIALFFFSALVVYFLPAMLSRLLFFVYLLLFYKSTNNYFWIAFVFLLLATPMGLFSGGLRDDSQRLPLYSFGAGFSFSFFDLFYVTAIFKAINIKNNIPRYYFNTALQIVIAFGILLLVYSLLTGINVKNIILIVRTGIFPFAFFIFAPRLITTTDQFTKLIRLLLPFVFLSFIGQVYEISFGRPLVAMMRSGAEIAAESGIAEGSDKVSRAFDSEFLNTLSIIFCSFFLISGDKNFKPVYLLILIFLNFFICFTSATRGSFLSYAVIVALLFWFIIKSSTSNSKHFKYIFITIIIVAAGWMALKSSNKLNTQVELSGERLSSLSSIASGDVTSVNARVDERIPKLMAKFKERPLFGWGFSSESIDASDGHVGMHNMLREGGILEMIVFAIFFYQVVSIPRRMRRKKGILQGEANALSFVVIAFLSLLIEHTTSMQYFGYLLQFEPKNVWMIVTILLVGINLFYRKTNINISYRLTAPKYENNNPLRRNGNTPA